MLRIAEIVHRISSEGERSETFDAGPNILVVEDRNGHEKLEVAIEHDSLMGDFDEIEVSIHVYRDGQPVPMPVVPRLTFTLQQEKEIWRLAEITAAAHIPLTDPDYLKSLRAQENEANENTIRSRLAAIGFAENGYAAAHPDKGYTCSLSALFASNPSSPQGVYDPAQGNEEWNRYRFAISGCEGSPASAYHVIAVPIDTDPEVKTFCSDQAGIIKFVTDDRPTSCFSQGKQFVNTNSAASGFSVE